MKEKIWFEKTLKYLSQTLSQNIQIKIRSSYITIREFTKKYFRKYSSFNQWLVKHVKTFYTL